MHNEIKCTLAPKSRKIHQALFCTDRWFKVQHHILHFGGAIQTCSRPLVPQKLHWGGMPLNFDGDYLPLSGLHAEGWLLRHLKYSYFLLIRSDTISIMSSLQWTSVTCGTSRWSGVLQTPYGKVYRGRSGDTETRNRDTRKVMWRQRQRRKSYCQKPQIARNYQKLRGKEGSLPRIFRGSMALPQLDFRLQVSRIVRESQPGQKASLWGMRGKGVERAAGIHWDLRLCVKH